MASGQSQLLETAMAVIDGYNKWDIDAILAPRAPNCTQRVYPNSLRRPTLNNDEYREWFSQQVIPFFEGFTVEILEIVEDAKNHKVVIHARSTAQTPVGPYGNEYMLMMQMTDDDKQLLHMKEFVDSHYSQTFFPKLEAYLSEKQQ